ncbi:MAG TPA: hypothetical protein VF800_30700 [Telluria sp.]
METLKVDYWDVEENCQKQRDMTVDEIAQRELDLAQAAVLVVPTQIPMLNARLALIAAGWMTAVKTYTDTMTGVEGEQARAFLEYALNVRRDHWMVEGFRVALDKTHAEIDELFIASTAYG